MIGKRNRKRDATAEVPRVLWQEEKIIRGYRVTVKWIEVDPAEAEAKRKAIAGVIARSLKRSFDESKAS